MTGRGRSATDEVFLRLREQILTGVLPPDSRHSVYRLADELGVSRTPVREAVLRLADLELVTIERNRGIVIRGVRAEDVREVFELRLLLEVPAAAAAAAHAEPELESRLRAALARMRAVAAAGDEGSFTEHDRELHAMLGHAAANSRLAREVDRLRDSIQVRGVSTIHSARTMSEIADEHEPIVDAVCAGDTEAAAAAMREHLRHTAALLLEQLGHEPSTLRDWPTPGRYPGR